VYERTTTARTAAIAIEIGRTRWPDPAEAAISTASAASVAYATDESGSEAKIGRASVFERSVSCISPLARGRPTTTRLKTSSVVSLIPASRVTLAPRTRPRTPSGEISRRS